MDGANPSFIYLQSRLCNKNIMTYNYTYLAMDSIIQVKLSISIQSAVLTTEHVCDSCTVSKEHKNMLAHCKQMLEHSDGTLSHIL